MLQNVLAKRLYILVSRLGKALSEVSIAQLRGSENAKADTICCVRGEQIILQLTRHFVKSRSQQDFLKLALHLASV